MAEKQNSSPVKTKKPEPKTTAALDVPVAESPVAAALNHISPLGELPQGRGTQALRQAAVLRFQQQQGNGHALRLFAPSPGTQTVHIPRPPIIQPKTKEDEHEKREPETELDTTPPIILPSPAPSPPPDDSQNGANPNDSTGQRGLSIQTKLTVNTPNDPYEKEADHVAETVMRMTVVEGENREETEPTQAVRETPSTAPTMLPAIQASGIGADTSVSQDVETRISRMKGTGAPLPEGERRFFEPRIGADFSGVRIHTGSDAIQTSRDLQARAYTLGSDIAFAPGEYQPGSDSGRKLLAHELTHVVQQGAAGQVKRKKRISARAYHRIQRKEAPAPASADADPGFQAVISQVKQTAAEQKKHEPTSKKVQEAQNAAVMPESEKKGKAQDKQSQEIEGAATAQEAKASGGDAPGFNKEAFKSAIKAKIESLTPEDPKKLEDIESSGVMEQTETAVKSKVGQGKAEAQGTVDDKVKEEPDKGSVPDKAVAPLQGNDPGAPPPQVDTSAAAPKPKGTSEVEQPMQERSKTLDEQMKEGDVTEEQLEKSNEPEFQGALATKKESQENAQKAPAAYRPNEAGVITQGQGEAQTAESTKAAAMTNARQTVHSQLDTTQTTAKGSDEAKRQEIGQKIDSIYNQTKTDVEGILKKLDADVDKAFSTGAANAAKTAIDYIKRETKAYKDRRYTGDGDLGDRLVGGIRWVGDNLIDMPPEYYEYFKQGRDLYIQEMDTVLDQVADIVGGALTQAKTRIAKGRQEISDFVAKQPQELQQVAQEAANNVQSKFDELEQTVNAKEQELIDSLSQKYSEGLQNLDNQIQTMMEEDKGLWAKAKEKIGGVIETITKLKEMLLGVLARAADAIDKIIKDPIGFLGNLISAVKQGLENFVGNIGTHLKKGLMSWLFGEVAKAGIQLPETFDLKGILSLALQLLGISWANLRARAVKLFGERVVGGLEKAWEVFQIIQTQGIGGLWEYIKDQLTNLKEMVIDGIKDMVITEVIKAGIKWLIGILGGPAGAFVKACMMIYDIIMWFINNGSRLMALVEAVISSVAAIAAGNIGGAAKFIENSLAQAIPVVIGFLASLLGIGNLSEKIKGIIQKIQEPVNKAIDWLLNKAKAIVKKLGKALLGKGKKPGENKESVQVKELARQKVAEKTKQPFKDRKELDARVNEVLVELRPKGLKQLNVQPKKDNPSKFDIIAIASPPTDVGDAEITEEEVPFTEGEAVKVKFKGEKKRFSAAKVSKIDKKEKLVWFTRNTDGSKRGIPFARVKELENIEWTKGEGEHTSFIPKILDVKYENEERVVTFEYEDDGKQKKFTVRQSLADNMTKSAKGSKLSLKPVMGRGVTEESATHQRGKGMHNAHLIADWFGGSGYKQSLNLISTSDQFNTSVMGGVERAIANQFVSLGADHFDMQVDVEWGEFVDGKANTETEAQIKARVTAEVETSEKASREQRISDFVKQARSAKQVRPKRCEKVTYVVSFMSAEGAGVGNFIQTIGPDKWITV